MEKTVSLKIKMVQTINHEVIESILYDKFFSTYDANGISSLRNWHDSRQIQNALDAVFIITNRRFNSLADFLLHGDDFYKTSLNENNRFIMNSVDNANHSITIKIIKNAIDY